MKNKIMDEKKIENLKNVLYEFIADSDFDEDLLMMIVDIAIVKFPSHISVGILEQVKHDYLKMCDEIEAEEKAVKTNFDGE
jgi:hypothetical protein